MIVGVLKEPSYESRVSLLAEGIVALGKKKAAVWVEPGAGEKAFCSDEDYNKAGALIRPRSDILAEADVILGIQYDDIPATVQNKILIGVYQPLFNPILLPVWAKQHITSFSLDMLPRTTRAQSMDVLSSQANIAGYKAVLLAANLFPIIFLCS